MENHAQEEYGHAMKIYEYVFESLGCVKLAAIEGPPTDWPSIKAIAEKQLEHEKKVTSMINALVKMAKEENDYATEAFLQWFVTEQVEEEAAADEIIQKLEMIGDTKPALYMLDKEMGRRQAD